jgi:hypothetical protein
MQSLPPCFVRPEGRMKATSGRGTSSRPLMHEDAKEAIGDGCMRVGRRARQQQYRCARRRVSQGPTRTAQSREISDCDYARRAWGTGTQFPLRPALERLRDRPQGPWQARIIRGADDDNQALSRGNVGMTKPSLSEGEMDLRGALEQRAHSQAMPRRTLAA